MEPIIFAITIIIVVFLFLIQAQKAYNSFLITVDKIEKRQLEERELFLRHYSRLTDRIQTGDAKQAAFLNRDKTEPEKEAIKPRTVDVGTATGLEAVRE